MGGTFIARGQFGTKMSDGAAPVDVGSDSHALHPVDTRRAQDGVWLVKVPNYLADIWLKSKTTRVVGKMILPEIDANSTDQRQKPNVRLVTDDALLQEIGEDAELIPKEHEFLLHSNDGGGSKSGPRSAPGQEMLILCEEASSSSAPASSNARQTRSMKRISLFGRVNNRAECRPPSDRKYMMLKAQQMKQRNQPKHRVQILDRPVQTKMPVGNQTFDIESEVHKRREGKNLRREREDVLRDLYKAFERHQYYSFKDLLAITRQPSAYLSEILKEIAVFNNRPPHHNMWELKQEYRHYATPKEGEGST